MYSKEPKKKVMSPNESFFSLHFLAHIQWHWEGNQNAGVFLISIRIDTDPFCSSEVHAVNKI